jgi:hypothetical protein
LRRLMWSLRKAGISIQSKFDLPQYPNARVVESAL